MNGVSNTKFISASILKAETLETFKNANNDHDLIRNADDAFFYTGFAFFSGCLSLVAHAIISFFSKDENEEGAIACYKQVTDKLIRLAQNGSCNLDVDQQIIVPITGKTSQFCIEQNTTANGAKILKAGFITEINGKWYWREESVKEASTSLKKLCAEHAQNNLYAQYSQLRKALNDFKQDYLQAGWDLNIFDDKKNRNVQQLVQNIEAERAIEELSSIRVFGESRYVCELAFNSDFIRRSSSDISVGSTDAIQKVNGSLLGVPQADRQDPEVRNRLYTRHVSIFQKTTLVDGPFEVVRPYVFSVPAPTRITRSVCKNFRDEVIQAAQSDKVKRVVLSAVGVIKAIGKSDTALDIVVDSIVKLRAAGKQVCFSDTGTEGRYAFQQIWDRANSKLLELSGASNGTSSSLSSNSNQSELPEAEEKYVDDVVKMIVSVRARGKPFEASNIIFSKNKAEQLQFEQSVNNKLAHSSTSLATGMSLSTSHLYAPLQAANGDHSAPGQGWVLDTDMLISEMEIGSLAGSGVAKGAHRRAPFSNKLDCMTTRHFINAFAARHYHNSSP